MAEKSEQSREVPISFTSDNVSLILRGLKTETRRLLNPQPVVTTLRGGGVNVDGVPMLGGSLDHLIRERFKMGYVRNNPRSWTPKPRRLRYEVDDILWVREAWQAIHVSVDPETGRRDDDVWWHAKEIPKDDCDGYWEAVYVATDLDDNNDVSWRPSIHMPRWACRLKLKVVYTRIERLHDITEDGARAEGVEGVAEYAALWDKINAKKAPWRSNPLVLVVRFPRRVQ